MAKNWFLKPTFITCLNLHLYIHDNLIYRWWSVNMEGVLQCNLRFRQSCRIGDWQPCQRPQLLLRGEYICDCVRVTQSISLYQSHLLNPTHSIPLTQSHSLNPTHSISLTHKLTHKLAQTNPRTLSYLLLHSLDWPLHTILHTQVIERDENRFNAADKDKSGFLSKDEFLDFLHPEDGGAHMRDVVIHETIADIDKDGDGLVEKTLLLTDLHKGVTWERSSFMNHEIIIDKDRQRSTKIDKDGDGSVEQTLSWTDLHKTIADIDKDGEGFSFTTTLTSIIILQTQRAIHRAGMITFSDMYC